jgi:PAS domain S-box-containing protein
MPKGKIEGIIGFGIEVTEQVKARKVIEESSAQIRTILEGLPQMAWMTDSHGKILFANKGTISYTGISTEEFLSGKTSLHPEDENARKIWQQHLEDGQAFEVQVRFKETNSGNYRWFLVRSNPVHDLQGKVSAWIGTATDIHDQKMFAEELERRVIERTEQLNTANINLERSNAELEHFAFVASHDLQEPLRKIQTFAERLHKTYRDSFPEAASPYLDKIKEASFRMGQLINDVLNFSRVGYSPQHLQTTDLEAVIKAALENFELKTVKVSVNQLPVIQAVTYQMQQLFHNLVSNALKFRSPDRTLELTIASRELSAEQAASYNLSRTKKNTTRFFLRIMVLDSMGNSPRRPL